MPKILYAADNRTSAGVSLKRFLDVYSNFYEIRVAAYSASVNNLNVNWTLDALLDFRGRFLGISSSNSNYALYKRGIEKFKPDLIISDLEPYTSYIGIELGIPVWQVSPLLLYYGGNDHSNIYKYYAGTFSTNVLKDNYIKFIINNSNKRLVLSHLGDLSKPPILKQGYEWVRPNYQLDIRKQLEVYGVQLADNYYYNEGKLDYSICDYKDPESIITCHYNQLYASQSGNLNIDTNIKFLSQHLDMGDI